MDLFELYIEVLSQLVLMNVMFL